MSDTEVPQKKARKPLSEESKAKRRANLEKARLARSTKTAERRAEEKEEKSILKDLLSKARMQKEKKKKGTSNARPAETSSDEEEPEQERAQEEEVSEPEQERSFSASSESEPEPVQSDSESEQEEFVLAKTKKAPKQKAGKADKPAKKAQTSILEQLAQAQAELKALKKNSKQVNVYVNHDNKAKSMGLPASAFVGL
jgi:hypothetical protein